MNNTSRTWYYDPHRSMRKVAGELGLCRRLRDDAQ